MLGGVVPDSAIIFCVPRHVATLETTMASLCLCTAACARQLVQRRTEYLQLYRSRRNAIIMVKCAKQSTPSAMQ